MRVTELIDQLRKLNGTLRVFAPTGVEFREVASMEVSAVGYDEGKGGFCIPVAIAETSNNTQELGVFLSTSTLGCPYCMEDPCACEDKEDADGEEGEE